MAQDEENPFGGLALVQTLLESGVAEQVDEDTFRWVGDSREEAVQKYEQWAKANPERAALFHRLLNGHPGQYIAGEIQRRPQNRTKSN